MRHGDGWYPIGRNPRHPLDTHARYAAGVQRLHRLAEVEGRDPAGITLAYWANWYDDTQAARLEEGERVIFTGSAGEVASDIGAFRDLGVRHLLLNFLRPTLEETLGCMERFAEQVRPQVS